MVTHTFTWGVAFLAPIQSFFLQKKLFQKQISPSNVIKLEYVDLHFFNNNHLGKLSNRKSNETWELVQSGDDPPP